MASSIVKSCHLTLLVRNGLALNNGAQNICSKQFVRLLSDLGSSAKKFPSLKISILGAPYEKGQVTVIKDLDSPECVTDLD
jgi:hypothetical protein